MGFAADVLPPPVCHNGDGVSAPPTVSGLPNNTALRHGTGCERRKKAGQGDSLKTVPARFRERGRVMELASPASCGVLRSTWIPSLRGPGCSSFTSIRSQNAVDEVVNMVIDQVGGCA